ncbi:hypothetical protein OIU76_025638 [Salix suchowensis]|nr:hypothetical protein OIU76_025638 [Salix suchowensis]
MRAKLKNHHGDGLSWILAFTLSMVSELSTSRVMVFPVKVFTKTCPGSWPSHYR